MNNYEGIVITENEKLKDAKEWRKEVFLYGTMLRTFDSLISACQELQDELSKCEKDFIHGYEKGIKNNPNEDEWRKLEAENNKLQEDLNEVEYAYQNLRENIMSYE